MIAQCLRAITLLARRRRRLVETLGVYGIVAVIVTALDYGSFAALVTLAGCHVALANVCGWAIAQPVGYLLHARWTFDAPRSWRGFFGFVALALVTLVLGTAFVVVANLFITPLAAKAASVILVFTVSFALSHLVLFRKV